MDNVMFYDSKKKNTILTIFRTTFYIAFMVTTFQSIQYMLDQFLILKSFFHSKTGINRAILRSNFSGCFILLYKCK